MPITRRALLASLAAVAGTVAARGAPIAAPVVSAASLAPLVDHLRREHKWAVEGLLRAVATGDFSPWDAGDEQEKPCRWRLARRVVAVREIDARTPLEQTLKAELLRLWDELACPNSGAVAKFKQTVRKVAIGPKIVSQNAPLSDFSVSDPPEAAKIHLNPGPADQSKEFSHGLQEFRTKKTALILNGFLGAKISVAKAFPPATRSIILNI